LHAQKISQSLDMRHVRGQTGRYRLRNIGAENARVENAEERYIKYA